ncbi:hypothetical protein H0S70_07060 [Chryseobacterium manosquense]|uniref:Uncharacterized protein n=1 Tax=Chryseobacterium manosquense TaxID=2754694 RepID=A0A7H1DT57_9FLAO|nr:hypothetical protein [Chryseobacterium manosquense]QNS40165.1 hypothetical protein H0S70_07060 [Chryseobacterium manosquense]
MKKEEVFIDLSKCSEEEIIKIYHVLNDKNENIYHSDRMILKKGKFENRFPYLTLNSGYTQWMSTFVNIHGKTELTYPEFIKLFEGGEYDWWIKIESEADLPKEAGDYWVFWDNKVIIQYWFTIGDYALKNQTQDWMQVVTHYQPIRKPLPPLH